MQSEEQRMEKERQRYDARLNQLREELQGELSQTTPQKGRYLDEIQDIFNQEPVNASPEVLRKFREVGPFKVERII